MKLTTIILLTISGPVLAYTDADEAQAFFWRHYTRSLMDDTADHSVHTGEALLWRRGRNSKLKPGKSTVAASQAAVRESATGKVVATRLKAIVADREGSPPASYVERQAKKDGIQAAFRLDMEHASKSIAEAKKEAALMASRGESEPPRPSKAYKDLEDSKTRLRRTQKEVLQKIDVSADALRKGPAMDLTTRHKFSQAENAIDRAHELANKFTRAHHAAGISAADQGRWSDVPDHVKKEQKASARNNAIVSYYDAIRMEQIDQDNKEYLNKTRKARDDSNSAVERAIAYGIGSRRETNAARQYYSASHARYLDARRRFPDDSSSEDEERKFP